MTNGVWGLEIDPPDVVQTEAARDGYTGQLEFEVRVSKHHAETPFVNNAFLRKWAAQYSKTTPVVARLVFSVNGSVVLMHNLMLTPVGRSMLHEAKKGGVGSLIEIRMVKWLKENFPHHLVMDLNPTGYRLEQLRARGQPIGKPIPVSRVFELIKQNLVRTHTRRFRWKRMSAVLSKSIQRLRKFGKKS